MLCLRLTMSVNVCGCVAASLIAVGASRVSWYSVVAATEICNCVPLFLIDYVVPVGWYGPAMDSHSGSRSSSLIDFLGPVSYPNHYYWLRITELMICAAIKIGEAVYLCRTCRREYDHSMEICEKCYQEDSEKHAGHEMGRLAITRVTNMPDDMIIQANNWWRCSSPGCNTGASLFLLT